MSRHRRQRNKRWQQALNRADSKLVEYGMRTYDHHGKISTTLPPLEKLIVVTRVKAELHDYEARLRRLRIRQQASGVLQPNLNPGPRRGQRNTPAR